MKANKALGQNFLIDKNIINKIINSTTDNPNKTIIEVGPGMGALTKELVKNKEKEIIAVEIDDELYEYLKKEIKDENLKLVSGNILDFETSDLSENKKYSVVANLPYYISSKIIFKFLEDDNCDSMTIMLQKELVDRITSTRNKKLYGRLTVAIQSFYVTSRVTNVPPTCFKPRPKVDSAVVRLERIEDSGIKDKTVYLEFIKQCFTKKRKTLRNNLKVVYTDNQIEDNLSKVFGDNWEMVRGESVSISEFKKLFTLFSK